MGFILPYFLHVGALNTTWTLFNFSMSDFMGLPDRLQVIMFVNAQNSASSVNVYLDEIAMTRVDDSLIAPPPYVPNGNNNNNNNKGSATQVGVSFLVILALLFVTMF